MKNNNLPPISAEERLKIVEKAKETRENQKKYALEHLKTTWSDLGVWREMASRQGTQLPSWYVAGNQLKYVKRLFRNTNIDIQDYIADMGCSTLKEMSDLNPKANAQAMVGWALEYIEEKTHQSAV